MSPAMLRSLSLHPYYRTRRRREMSNVRYKMRLREETEGRGRREAGEERRGGHAEMRARHLGEERAEVGRHREVASLEELLAREPRPAAVDLPAAHAAAQHEHGGGVAVIGAAAAVLRHGAPELRHGPHDHAAPPG